MIKNRYTWVTFLLTMVPPVHIAFFGEAYEFLPTAATINLLIIVFVTLSNGKQRPLKAKGPCDDDLNHQ